MKTIIAVSDTHGKTSDLSKLISKVGVPDMLIHLGDIGIHIDELNRIAGCEVEAVAGNMYADYVLGYPAYKSITLGKYKVLLLHGYNLPSLYDLEKIREFVRDNKHDILIFGHSHRPLADMSSDVWLLNPGSISNPRQEDGHKTYLLLEIDDKDELHVTLNKL